MSPLRTKDADLRVRLLLDHNATCGKDSLQYARVPLYKDGPTVLQCYERGIGAAALRYDIRTQLIELVGAGELRYDECTQLWYRAGSNDLDIVHGAHNELAAAVAHEGDVVLDLGAHIGGYSLWCGRHHLVRHVVAVEAHPGTYDVLARNATSCPCVTPVHAAVLGCAPTSGETLLYLSSSERTGATASATVVPTNKRGAVRVPAVAFGSLLEQYRPDVVKIDIEGAEEGLDMALLPANTHTVALELHLYGRAAKANSFGNRLLLELHNQGFYVVHAPFGMYDLTAPQYSANWQNRLVLRRGAL